MIWYMSDRRIGDVAMVLYINPPVWDMAVYVGALVTSNLILTSVNGFTEVV